MRSWRTVRRMWVIVLGVYLGAELALWWHGKPDSSPTVETIDFVPAECR